MQVISTNTLSINSQRQLYKSGQDMQTSMQRLSSGLRINSAKDDAAGLAISERMTSGIRGMTVAVRNANDAISMAQVTEGALGQVGDILQRMRDLAMQSSNATNSDDDRTALNKEFAQLQKEITRITGDTEFNGIDVLKMKAGSATSAGLSYQVGANFNGTTSSAATSASTNSDQIFVDAIDITSAGAQSAVSVAANASSAAISSQSGALNAVTAIDAALKTINDTRADLGAVQSRFQVTINTLQTSIENLSASRSRIRDADFAVETANMSRAQILQQAGTAMLAQANAAPQNVLSLLR